ncbi:2-dehydropantoate 2-reductase N-terminal domain-containing protein [soil metagenome]
MRYVVYGAGAVGGVIGARLHLAGLETTLIARGAHLEQIRRDGLVLDGASGSRVVRPAAADTVAGVTWTDDTVVLLCVKGHQSPAALADLVAHAPVTTPVVCAQNGVANEIEALRRFAHTYGLCVMLPSLHLEPGTVVEKCSPVPGILDLGRFPAGVDATAESVAADLRAAGFESLARPDIMAWKYRKLLVNAGGDVGAILGPGGDAGRFAALVRAEGEAVLKAAGIAVVTDEQDDVRRGETLRPRADIDAYPGNSLRQSLARGLESEIDYRAGEIVLLGRLHGIGTPANELLRQTVLRLDGPGAVAPEAGELLALLPTP